MHAGHYVGRQNQRLKFHEKNVNGQCAHDNVYQEGEKGRYYVALNKKYGPGTAEYLDSIPKGIYKRSRFDYEQLIKIYKEKVEIERKRVLQSL